uniref:CCDC92 domain-containing protein n=2 Tax=Mesocestoides corti TaxID=53468 RepID=A0A5K3F5B5_MESCO
MAAHHRTISGWDRDKLEDAYLRIYDENTVMRKIIAEDKVKLKTRLATKLLRITEDNKNFWNAPEKESARSHHDQRSTANDMNTSSGESPPSHVGESQERKAQIAVLEQAIKQLYSQNIRLRSRIKDLESVIEDQKALKWSKQMRAASEHRFAINRDFELIRLQRQLIEKQMNHKSLPSRLNSKEQRLRMVKTSGPDPETPFNRINKSIKDDIKAGSEQCGNLQSEGTAAKHRRKNEILRETGEELRKNPASEGVTGTGWTS